MRNVIIPVINDDMTIAMGIATAVQSLKKKTLFAYKLLFSYIANQWLLLMT